ncbi:MAG: serine/threonine-protein kinase [Polyangiaceae bacterium]
MSSPHLRQAKARVGSKAGKYTLDRLIDVGGMAAVYAGHHWTKKVAVKILHTTYMRSAEARQRFAREGYAANRIEHEDVVEVLDDGHIEDGNPFFVMELLDGWSLEQRLGREPAPIPEEAWWIADCVLDVLAVAHAENVIHRDLKPGNIFLTSEDRVKVLDFGLARLRDDDGSGRMTQTGTVIGTAHYMSPEQALRKPDLIDARSDLWSVGAIMWRMLCGRTVHDAHTTGAALIAAATKRARPILAVAPEVPEPVAAVIDRALAFDKRNRFDDAVSMRAALQKAFVDGVGPESVPRPSQSARSSGPPSSVPISVDEGPVNVRYDSTAEGDSILVTFEDEAGQSERVELRRRPSQPGMPIVDLDYEVVTEADDPSSED